jgi:anti-sigma regulatory factor (Ser/Thr protein kinase)
VRTTVERLKMSFVAEPQAVRAARNALSVFDGLIDEETRSTLRLLVSELLANAVVHGSRRPTDPIAMRVGLPAGKICVQVRDRGPGLGRVLCQRPGELRPDGWGLFLVDHLADRWGVRSRPANELWFELDLAARTGRRAH